MCVVSWGLGGTSAVDAGTLLKFDSPQAVVVGVGASAFLSLQSFVAGE
jgi:hypothetical protein